MMPAKTLTNLAAALILVCWLDSVWVVAQTKSESKTQPAAKRNEDAKQHSKPVSAGGADFEVVADRVWHRPLEIYDEAGANIGLRITNRGDKDLILNLGDTLKVSLKSADAKEA